jgi:hypothetical protein
MTHDEGERGPFCARAQLGWEGAQELRAGAGEFQISFFFTFFVALRRFVLNLVTPVSRRAI